MWEVIYVHFYNWDRLYDVVPVVSDLIELIIETSLWTMDYSTFDTHTRHARLLFNECLFHLCDCTWSNVLCILKCLLIKPKKIFEYFICFWKCFYAFVFWVFVLKLHFLCFSSKTFLEAFSQNLATKLFPRKWVKEKHENINFRQRLSWLSCDCFASKVFLRNILCFRGILCECFVRR